MVIILIGGLAFIPNKKTGNLDAFTQCVSDSGAKFYGAFWCSACQSQKETFNSSKKLLPYVECSTPDGKNQLEICIDEGIEKYPTWVFPDSSILTGVLSLETLSEKTDCELPQ